MSGIQTPITIKEATEKIFHREYLLPSFQREYVWNATQVINLFDSLMQDYPISSMLFWEVKNSSPAASAFEYYDFLCDYVEVHKTHNPKTIVNQDFFAVIDGQQRLTSLYLGLCGSCAYHKKNCSWVNDVKNFPPSHLYLKLDYNYDDNKSNEEDDIANENVITDIDQDNTNCKYQFDFLLDSLTGVDALYEDSKGKKWFRVGEIINIDKGALLQFCIKNDLTSNSNAINILDKLQEVICITRNINFYLDNTVNPNQAVNIFVRINSGGRPLSLSDILLSLTIAGWKSNAREEFINLSTTISTFGFKITHDYILKAYLCLLDKSVVYQISTFAPSFLASMESEWTDVKGCIIELFTLLQNFGLDDTTLKSYNATLPILYYMYHNHLNRNYATTISLDGDRKEVKKWLLKTLLYGSFGKSADSVIQKSIKGLKSQKSFPAKIISTNIGQPSIVDPMWIEDILTTQKDNPNAFSILSILYPDCNYAITRFDKDHLHPMAKFAEYKKLGGMKDKKEYNSIVNLQLLEESENRSKGDSYLKDWVASLSKTRTILEKETYIPSSVSLDLTDFDTFFDERKKILALALKKMLS